jgi:nitrogen-specific signal transduction histidine kinase/CheY-like chemotaxis protein
LRLTGANIDITHRKHLEEQVRQAQKMESIGRLAGSVAHDFNNLLTIITGYSQMVLDDLASHHPLREPVKEVSLAAERATALTRQLLAFSRRQVTEPRNVLLNDLLRDLERMLRRLIGEEVALELVLDADTGVIRADPGQIEQVVMNLVINAKDAMPNGGRVLVESSRQVFDPQSAEGQLSLSPGAYAVLAVSDTGIGMSPEVKSHIFEPFFTTKEQGKGTGLGLSTVYGIVQQSDGAISVYSEPGKGTTFKILLPASDSPPDESSLAEDGSIGHLGSGTILVAEDEPGVRDFICRTLTRHGYSVLAAPNGIEAMALLRRHGSPVDLLLTDVAMPEMGGVELSTQFSAAHPQVPVLLMSGYAERLLSEHLAGRHIQKPFTSAALLTRIGALLRHP